MDNKNRKIYNKALDFHEKGEINKALDLCESILAENLGESEVLNFKGLMLYEKGLLKEAVTVWKINVDLNNDSMAKSYIKDAEHDEERIKIYKEAEQALKRSDINNALKLFIECSKSDFNCIKVNTGIAWCYQENGDYYRAKEYVDKALKIDKNAVTANEIKRQLENLELYYAESKDRPGIGRIIGRTVIIILAVSILSVGGYYIWKNNMNNNDKLVDNIEAITDNTVNEEELDSKKNIENQEEKVVNKFDIELLKQDIKNNDYKSIYGKVHDVQTSELSADEKKIYNKAVSILKKDGAASFYEYGLWYYNQKDFDNAKDQFDKAYEYCDGDDLEQHIIFYRGSTASEQGNRDLALEMYKKYDELYPEGSYIEGVLYELALLSLDINKEESKIYAQRLINNYPDSIYVNDKIKNILNVSN